MDNKELMRVFAAYMPCKMKYDGYNPTLEVIGVLYAEGNLQVMDKTGHSDMWECNNYCKLILKHLSKITDEDAMEVAKILYDKYVSEEEEKYRIVTYAALGGDFIKTLYKTPLTCDKIISIIDFLRSRGYDCGHGQIPSLLEAGLAVEE